MKKGYFYINSYNNYNYKNKYQQLELNYHIQEISQYFKENYKLDKVLYDYMTKPTNLLYNNFLNMYLKNFNENDTFVVLSLFQLGKTKVDIYRVLEILRTKHVKLIVNTWKVDISSTMKKVVELSDDDLVIFENKQLIINNCYDSKYEDNIYRKLAGYSLDENYISMRTNEFLTNYKSVEKKERTINDEFGLKRIVYQEEYVVKKHNNRDYF